MEGHSGYLLRQAWHAFRAAMDGLLREHGLTGPQYAVLSVLARQPLLSGADLARVCNTTPQAMTGVMSTLERSGLIAREPHPTHGRIIQVRLTEEGRRRLDQATPGVRALERDVEAGLTEDELARVKRWLVAAARSASERQSRKAATSEAGPGAATTS